MKIYIDTNTFSASPGIYADAAKTKPLPRVIPLVQGFRDTVQVAFIGDLAPKPGDGVTLAMRPFGTQRDILVTQTVAATAATGEDGVAAVAEVNLAVDTSALVDALGRRETLNLLCGVIVTDDAAAFPTRVEWQLVLSVSASALDNGVPPDISPTAAEQLREEILALRSDIAEAVSSVYRYRGTVATEADLPADGNEVGDVWNVADTGLNYAWDGEAWDALAGDVYATKEDLAQKANDADVMHKTGAETITGVKTFANKIFANNDIEVAGYIRCCDFIDLEGNFIIGRTPKGAGFYGHEASLTSEICVLPLGTKTALGANAYGLHVSATGGLQLFGTHFLQGDIWTDDSIKMVKGNVSLYSTDTASIGFDYANEVIFRTMPNDGNEATYELQAWEWTDDSHTAKAATAGVKLLKPSQATELVPTSVLNMSEADGRYGQLTASNTWTGTNAFDGGTLTAKTQVETDSSSCVATTAFVRAVVAAGDFASNKDVAGLKQEVEDLDTRIDVLEGNAASTSLGLGWFQPNDSTEADTTAGYLDDKRRVLVGLDKTANVVMVRHGDYGSDGKWHDNTGVFAGIYAKFYDHENQAWKPAVPAAHATGKLYAENTLDKMGIMPWAGFREEVLTNTIGGETYEQHVIKIPKFYKAKFYNTTIRWKSAAASAGYIDVVGRIVIILPEKPVNSFTVGYDADGAGTNVLTVSPDDFALCGSCYRPKHVRSDTGEEIPAGETDCFYVSKYHPTNKTVGGVALLVSEKTASRNPIQTRNVFHTRAKANNQGSGNYIAESLPMDCSQDLIDLYEVEFATMDSQSVNTGATKLDASIGMAYTYAWQLNNAENLDNCVRLGLENVPVSGYVDYYGKCKTETDRAADETAAETIGNGKQYMSRFIWRGMTNDIFGAAWNFLGDIEVIQYAAGEVLPTDFPAETLQVLKDAGFAFTEDAEVGTVTVESTIVDVVCRRKRETPYENVSALATSSVATRDGFWESHIQTGLYEVVPVALPVASGSAPLRDAEGGYEYPSKAEKDFGIGGVDYFWSNTRFVAAVLVGGGSAGNTSDYGLRAWNGYYGASGASWHFGSRLYFVPFSAA